MSSSGQGGMLICDDADVFAAPRETRQSAKIVESQIPVKTHDKQRNTRRTSSVAGMRRLDATSSNSTRNLGEQRQMQALIRGVKGWEVQILRQMPISRTINIAIIILQYS